MSLTSPGFADPVHDSQACFRAVLDAMARPGTLHTIAAPEAAPPPLHRATVAVLLTLVDLDTPLWLDPAAHQAGAWIDFHCAAPRASLDQAAFVLALAPPDLNGVQAGSDDGPEDGATIILQIAALGSGDSFTLSGPGLEAPTRFHAEGLRAGFIASWAANHARFPRGVDLILCAGDQLAALPRTLTIQEG